MRNIYNMRYFRPETKMTLVILSVRHNFFLNRTTERWNSLKNYQIESEKLNGFKARIDFKPPVPAAIAS
jgi:hypothetical protein